MLAGPVWASPPRASRAPEEGGRQGRLASRDELRALLPGQPRRDGCLLPAAARRSLRLAPWARFSGEAKRRLAAAHREWDLVARDANGKSVRLQLQMIWPFSDDKSCRDHATEVSGVEPFGPPHKSGKGARELDDAVERYDSAAIKVSDGAHWIAHDGEQYQDKQLGKRSGDAQEVVDHARSSFYIEDEDGSNEGSGWGWSLWGKKK